MAFSMGKPASRVYSFSIAALAILAAVIIGFAVYQLLGVPPVEAQIVTRHTEITEYAGPSTCLSCHRDDAQNMFGAVHYQWTGPCPNVPNIEGNAGKADVAINTYCGSVTTSRSIACWSCHAGTGAKPTSTMDDAQLSNIDCLMCHQEQYRRTPSAPFENVTYTDFNGTSHTWRLPVEDAQGNFKYVINTAAMNISAVEAARTVHLPTRATCLTCHAYAAGSDCGKRGDLSTAMVNPAFNVDVHMSPDGQNIQCRQCHQEDQHHFLGRGLDLRENDRPERLTCVSGGCHDPNHHDNSRLNEHTARVACQSCHIPVYSKVLTTEISRDWTKQFWAQALFMGQGGYKPEENRVGNVIPTYAWFNGTSYVYVLGQQPPQRTDGAYELASPYGNVGNGMIFPMKEHTSNAAMHDATGQLIPWSVSTFFFTGNFTQSVEVGQQMSGLTGSWSLVEDHTYQTLNHQVSPSENALQCAQCHAEYAGGAQTRMTLQSMGYAPKASDNVLCVQCHDREERPAFTQLHDIHVAEEGRDCSNCHNFQKAAPLTGPSVTPPPANDGASLFTTYCSSCHGSLSSNTGRGWTATRIQTAIANVGSMRSLTSLSSTQVQAIATALGSPAGSPAPTTTPPVGAGESLYATYCLGCHGSLSSNIGKGWTPSRIQSAIASVNSMRSLSTLTDSQVQLIASALAAPSPEAIATPSSTGTSLYAMYCSGCHGPLASNNIRGRTAADIQSAISTISTMRQLSSLSTTEIQSIVSSLGGSTATAPPSPTTTATPPYSTDGAGLYVTYCAGCHGQLASNNIRGRTIPAIQSAISSVSSMRFLSSLSSSQLQAISTTLADSTSNELSSPSLGIQVQAAFLTLAISMAGMTALVASKRRTFKVGH